jgi:hypothetical protein
MQLYIAVCIRMLNGCHMFSRNNQQAGFFTTFTNGTGTGCLIGFAFSSREFRKACQRNTGRSYSDKNSTG